MSVGNPFDRAKKTHLLLTNEFDAKNIVETTNYQGQG